VKKEEKESRAWMLLGKHFQIVGEAYEKERSTKLE
jgi:hypothetical protein